MTSVTKFRLEGGQNPLILLPTRVNGQGPFPFILDTGAGHSLVTPELAERLGLEIQGTKEGHGAAGALNVSMSCVETLSVGGAQVENVPVAITGELHRIAAAIGASIEGDVGYNFLKHFVVTIDYRNEALRLSQEDALTVKPLSETPFRLAHPAKPLIVLPVRINGQGPFPFALDTGTSTSAISEAVIERLGIPVSVATTITAGGGTLAAKVGQVRSMAVGAALQEDVAVVRAGFLEMLSRVTGAQLDGILGYNFLRHYTVTIDYPRAALRLA
jgi:predicted aspartyl protease